MFSYCRNCGKPVSDSAETCPICGVSLKTYSHKFCPFCGASTKNVRVVCPKCKSYLPGSLARPKSRVLAGLFAIVLGAFGIHKFYLGYFTEGLIIIGIYLLLGRFLLGYIGVAVHIFTIMEGVIYLSQSNEGFHDTYVRNKKKWL